MMRLALDTNAHRAYLEGNHALKDHVMKASALGLPITVLGEIYYGAFNGNRSADSLRDIQRFLAAPRLEILNITPETARLYGEISTELRRLGRPIQQNDVWIAALCKQYGYVLATADTDFDHILGLELLHF